MAARTGNARLAAVLGYPAKHSLSPALHEFWLQQYGIDGAYIPLEISPERLENTLLWLRDSGFSGVNLTIPHKVQGYLLADAKDERAEQIGAANTLVFSGGRTTACNTDAYGFSTNLKEGGFTPGSGTQALVIGAGGAARSVLVSLLEDGVENIVLLNRTVTSATALRDELCASCRVSKALIGVGGLDTVNEHLTNARLIVNTTPLGMKGEAPLQLDLALCKRDTVVTDIVYSPLKTPLLEQAESAGLYTVDGLGMLIHQAAPAFEMFFGVWPEVTAALRTHLEKLLP